MDYEKAYKQALERAKELLLGNEHSNTIRSYFEHIFPELRPELRESEDERIRKALIMLVQESLLVHQGCCKCFHEFTEEQLLAWLEKQKEPHKRLRDKTPWIVTAKEELTHDEERLQANLEELHRIRAEKEKQKEQKPIECSDCAKHLEGYISGRVDAEKKLLDEYGILIMPEGELRMKPQWKPSEEQMEALRKAVNKLANTDVADSVRLSIMYDNLKKL